MIKSEVLKFDELPQKPIGESRSGEFVGVSVIDTGSGMDRHTQQHIFEPFFTTKDQGKGTGLGLSVVYGVVNSHEGFITVQSDVGKGSMFSMFFPMLTDKEKLHRTAKQQKLPRGNERVLVIDDEEHVGEVIGGMLTDLGYAVTTVQSGKAAIDLLKKKKRFDLIVLDMNMPTMGGRETFYKLKELHPDVRVVISTGYSNTSLDGSPLRQAVDGVLQKPYQLEDLSHAVRAALEGKGE